MVKSHHTHRTLCMTGAPTHSTPRNSWLRVAEDPIMDRSPGKPGPSMVDAPKSLRMHKKNLGDFGDFRNDIYIQIILNIDPVVLNSSKHHLLNATFTSVAALHILKCCEHHTSFATFTLSRRPGHWTIKLSSWTGPDRWRINRCLFLFATGVLFVTCSCCPKKPEKRINLLRKNCEKMRRVITYYHLSIGEANPFQRPLSAQGRNESRA